MFHGHGNGRAEREAEHLRAFPRSIASEYLRLADRQPNRFPVLLKIVNRRLAELERAAVAGTGQPTAAEAAAARYEVEESKGGGRGYGPADQRDMRPATPPRRMRSANSSTVFHLRTGDVVEEDRRSATELLLGRSWSGYVKPLAYFEGARVPRDPKTIVLVSGTHVLARPSHRPMPQRRSSQPPAAANGTAAAAAALRGGALGGGALGYASPPGVAFVESKSCLYLEAVASYWRSRGWAVEVRLTQAMRELRGVASCPLRRSPLSRANR